MRQKIKWKAQINGNEECAHVSLAELFSEDKEYLNLCNISRICYTGMKEWNVVWMQTESNWRSLPFTMPIVQSIVRFLHTSCSQPANRGTIACSWGAGYSHVSPMVQCHSVHVAHLSILNIDVIETVWLVPDWFTYTQSHK